MRIYVRPTVGPELDVPVSSDIVFEDDDGSRVVVSFSNHDHEVDVRTEHGQLVVLPLSGNLIHVKAKERL